MLTVSLLLASIMIATISGGIVFAANGNVNQAIAPSASVVGLVTVIATGLVIVHVIVRATIVVPSINMEK